MIQNSDLQFLGAKNYLLSPGIETGRQGWGLFNTTLTSKIPTGTITAGAASITTFAPTSTNPLSGDYSLRVASSGAVTAGHGFISDAFTIDRQDKAKVLGFSFSYEAISGTMDFSGTSANTWAVYIYDVDGAAWIQPAGVYNMVQSAGVGIASGTFQTTATGTQYRIAVVCITATGGAVEVRFDSFNVGPQKVLAGAAVSDWVSYTPTIATGQGSIVASNLIGKYRRVGDSAEVVIQYDYSSGTGAAANFTITTPFTMDGAKLPGNGMVGSGFYFSNATGFLNTDVRYVTATSVIFTKNGITGFLQGTDADDAGTGITAKFTIPVSGWSSNTVMSQDTDTRVVAASFSVTGSHTSSGSFQAIPSLTVRGDTHGMISGTTLTIPVSGWYDFSGNIGFASNATGIRDVQIAFSPTPSGVPFSPTTQFSSPQVALSGGQTHVGVGGAIYINAGTQITFNAYQNSGGSLAYGDTLLTIKRLSGPATIAASETVAAYISRDSGNQSIAIGGGSITHIGTARIDTHGGYNASTGNYIVPVSGLYEVTFRSSITTSGASSSTVFSAAIVMGGATFQSLQAPDNTTNGNWRTPSVTAMANLVAGSTIYAFTDANNSATVIGSTAQVNGLSIKRIK